MLKAVKNFLLDVIFPKKCLNCGREGAYFCEDCLSLIEINPFEYCLCEKPQKLMSTGKCWFCRDRKLNGLYSAASFKERRVKLLVHHLKYLNQIKELADYLSFLILAHFNFITKEIPSDSLLVPVPLFIKRKKARGFNQAEEIAKIISAKTGAKISLDNLKRIRNTQPQVKLNKMERIENIKNAFAVSNAEEFKKKIIFLVDDVYTTGATMEECAKELKRAGASEVWGLTAARETN
ncbi:MAG: ComF family protein [Candidatus Pacebacteria bacterium]|nr:ComF family protein [Candidatus Paceibacterota bacterium]